MRQAFAWPWLVLNQTMTGRYGSSCIFEFRLMIGFPFINWTIYINYAYSKNSCTSFSTCLSHLLSYLIFYSSWCVKFPPKKPYGTKEFKKALCSLPLSTDQNEGVKKERGGETSSKPVIQLEGMVDPMITMKMNEKEINEVVDKGKRGIYKSIFLEKLTGAKEKVLKINEQFLLGLEFDVVWCLGVLVVSPPFGMTNILSCLSFMYGRGGLYCGMMAFELGQPNQKNKKGTGNKKPMNQKRKNNCNQMNNLWGNTELRLLCWQVECKSYYNCSFWCCLLDLFYGRVFVLGFLTLVLSHLGGRINELDLTLRPLATGNRKQNMTMNVRYYDRTRMNWKMMAYSGITHKIIN